MQVNEGMFLKRSTTGGTTFGRFKEQRDEEVKKRVLSAAGRAAIAKAAKKRWAKVKKQAKK
jgi:hypothetical protein